MAVDKTYALTTRDRVIDFLELKNLSATDNTVIDIFIETSTEFIENYCQRRFMKTTYTDEVYDGDGSEFVRLKQYPVISGETFSLSRRNSVSNEDDWSSIDSEDYFVDEESGIVEYIKGMRFQNYPQHYKITYTAGFDFDNATTFLADTTAGDVEYACWKLCSVMWNRRKADPSVQSEKLGNYAVTYRKFVNENTEIASILDKYARVSMGGLRN